nr:immunoglobulin light chain junction region [Macaca mulatta]
DYYCQVYDRGVVLF